jgi:hypothetical protein
MTVFPWSSIAVRGLETSEQFGLMPLSRETGCCQVFGVAGTDPPPPPPQADRSSELANSSATGIAVRSVFMMSSPFSSCLRVIR